MLTPDTYKDFAVSCLTVPRVFEEEFNSTLRKPGSVSRNISKYEATKDPKYLRVALNEVVIFFNLFDRKRGLELFEYLVAAPFSIKAMSLVRLFKIDTQDYQYDEEFEGLVRREIQI